MHGLEGVIKCLLALALLFCQMEVIISNSLGPEEYAGEYVKAVSTMHSL